LKNINPKDENPQKNSKNMERFCSVILTTGHIGLEMRNMTI
jgi:hypothetical protein